MGIEMGIPNFNFQKLPKSFINMNVNQPQKKQPDSYYTKYKDKFINESLLNFSKEEKNPLLKELVNNIIDFRKKCVNQNENDIKIKKIIAGNYLFFHDIEKNLIEISYISNKEYRDEKIEVLYNWYKNILKKNKMLKKMQSKSYKSVNERYDFNEEKNNDENEEIQENKEDKDIKKEVNEEINTGKEIIIEEKEKEEVNKKKEKEETKEIIQSDIIDNKLSESFSRKERLRLASAKEQNSDIVINSKSNLSWNFMTRLHIRKNCSNKHSLPRTNSEIISSSFITPTPYRKISFPVIKEKHFHIEKDIMDSKLKMLREKRHWEDINIHINKFGMNRAKFKENLNNKYEMKELIRMYVNEHKNDTEINNSKLLKKYLKKRVKFIDSNKNKIMSSKSNNIFNSWSSKSIKISEKKSRKNINNVDLDLNKKKERIFYGISHTKIFLHKIQNINPDTKIINNNEDRNITTFNIKLKISGKDIKINNLLSKSTGDKNDLIKETANNIISGDYIFNEKFKNKNMSYDIDIYKKTVNTPFDNNNSEEEEEEKEDNNKEKKEDEYNIDINDFYNLEKEEEEKKKHIRFNLSLFHTNNIKKIHLYKNKYKKPNMFRKIKFKPLNLNEKRKFELYHNFNHNKSDFLSIRKNMEILNKIDFKQINAKNENIYFYNSCRYDNIDEDDKIVENDIEENSDKKIENTFQTRYNLSRALFTIKDKNYYSLYYYPRPGSKLLIKK